LATCERAQLRDGVDGAWWPSSSDLSLELPDLVAIFSLWIGQVNRVVYDPRSGWLSTPPRILSRNSMVSVDPYRLLFPDTIYLRGTHARDAVLFVLSPTDDSGVARQLLTLVAASVVPLTSSSLNQSLGELRTSTVCR
jgi:hypothetical protein